MRKVRHPQKKITAYFRHELNKKIQEHRDEYIVMHKGCQEGDLRCWALLKRKDDEDEN